MIKKHTSASRQTITKGCTLIGFTAVLACANAHAEVEHELDELIVSAWRMPMEGSKLSSAVNSLDLTEMEAIGLLDVKDALDRIPGVVSTSLGGQTGALGSVYIRGTTSSYSQLVVDGIRVSDSTSPMGNFLSGARLNDFSKIEVIRGPQAAIHGGESVGGVLWMETARGSGEAETYQRTEVGSFDTQNGFVSYSGSENNFSWYLGGGYENTDNDAPNESYDLIRSSMRLEWAQTKDLTLGITYRGQDSRFQYDFFGNNLDYVDSHLFTTYANTRLAPGWVSNVVMGFYSESFDNDTAFGNYGADLERVVISNDQSYEITEEHILLFGGYLEQSDYANTINTVSDEYRYGGHLGMLWKPMERFSSDAVIRWEDYVNYQDQVTWRLGGSWQVFEKTRLRLGMGEAFRTPTLLDLYGTSFGLGDPNLSAEESLGWDFGVEQEWMDRHHVHATYFENSIENQIQTTFVFPVSPPPVNLLEKTRTSGMEFAADGAITDEVKYYFSWMWLCDSLQEQPENTATASIQYQATEKLLLGFGASYVDTRSYGGAPLEDYMLIRIHANYELKERLIIHARVENIADQEYELANFATPVKGAGLGFFTGITATF
jgi:vitamin B12 transporter